MSAGVKFALKVFSPTVFKTISPSTQVNPEGKVTVESFLSFLPLSPVGSVKVGLAFLISKGIFLTSFVPSFHLYPASRVAFAVYVPAFVLVLPVIV